MEKYTKAQMEVIEFENEDVIMVSIPIVSCPSENCSSETCSFNIPWGGD